MPTSERTPLNLGSSVSGLVADNVWNYYAVGGSSGQHELRVQLTDTTSVRTHRTHTTHDTRAKGSPGKAGCRRAAETVTCT